MYGGINAAAAGCRKAAGSVNQLNVFLGIK